MVATIAASVGSSDTSPKPPKTKLIEYLRRKTMLLVLDNLEQIRDAAHLIADVLAECPGLCVLATSRERLHLRAEQRFHVLPLDLAPAIELFVQRAQAVNADFRLTPQNQPTVAAICQRLELEHDNLRAALGWWAERSDQERLGRTSYALWEFWLSHGHRSEGRRWLARALDTGSSSLTDHPVLKAQVLLAAGVLAEAQGAYGMAQTLLDESLALFQQQSYSQGYAAALQGLGQMALRQSNYGQATEWIREALSVARAIGDRLRIASSLNWLSSVMDVCGDPVAARELAEESLTLFRALGMKEMCVDMLSVLGGIAMLLRDYAGAVPLLEESLALSRGAGYRQTISTALNYLGQVAMAQSDPRRAAALFAESLELRRELGDRRGSIPMLVQLSEAMLECGDIMRARALLGESFTLSGEIGYHQGYSWGLVTAAKLAVVVGQAERATRLLGADEALRESHDIPINLDVRRRYDMLVAHARSPLAEEAFAITWAAGRAMSLQQAIACALGEDADLTHL